MPKYKTYFYAQGGHEEGPYFESQIVKMAEAGIIRADAEIRCVNDGAKGSIGDFLYTIEKDLAGTVTVTDFKMPFWSMVSFMVKWVFASIPAAIILFLIVVFVAGIFGGTVFSILRH